MKSAFKERPILFSAPMVRAILDGRKAQTRRVMKPQPEPCHTDRGGHWILSKAVASMVHVEQELMNPSYEGLAGSICPYGDKFDRIWVRETWGLIGQAANSRPSEFHDPELALKEYLIYRAGCDGYDEAVQHWRPSIHMPRWASRINLEITGVRVERLQDISEEDAIAEGVSGAKEAVERGGTWYEKPRLAYRFLWESINGRGSWDANPWVWVIEFKKL